ncbi:hypothetical protein A6V39_03365 [Candidatus Mycoplasma haematobovis]|uniref:Uncharacterized protein n=1 Tax=Candidatus Mycoplasma haematobovis TaxID=432608 RepID=A0A1A9QCV5_9MOLU|nr:hypothetical protein [Candidatus Mycoplasma haematobovis]OAL09924.1 hypothetical protein A6V39_03365 [Candidatus Mycoplasma haematobovis]
MLGLSNKTIAIVSGVVGTTAIGGGVTTVYLNSDNNKGIKAEPNKQTQIEAKSTPVVTTATTKSVVEFLKAKNLELIGDEDTDKWNQSWTNFKQAYNNKTLPEGWDLKDKKESQSIPDEFKTLCKEKSNKQIRGESDSDFELTKTYCTKQIQPATEKQ